MAKEESSEKPTNPHLCRRCGRKLKSIASQEKGMGETCYRKFMLADSHKKLF